MTPDETKLSATLHQKLGVVESPVKCALIELSDELGTTRFLDVCLGTPVYASFSQGYMTLSRGGKQVTIDPRTFQALLRFAESIGWQCD